MEKFKVFVGQEFRTNPQSAIPGGSVVEVHFEKRIKVYNNIKNPKAYIQHIEGNSTEPIIKIVVDGIETKFN
jgi:hypothetical protein